MTPKRDVAGFRPEMGEGAVMEGVNYNILTTGVCNQWTGLEWTHSLLLVVLGNRAMSGVKAVSPYIAFRWESVISGLTFCTKCTLSMQL